MDLSGPDCEEKADVRKGAWTEEEDRKLVDFIERNKGHGCWRTLPHRAGLQRCGKSCRLRWTNYLRPNIKRGNFSAEEESTIVRLHALMGNKWATIASHLPGRTDNEIKNHWNTRLRKRLARIAFDNIFHNMHRYGLQRSLASTIQNPYRQLMGSTSIPTASFSLTHSPLNGGDSRDKLCKRACDGNVPDSNYTQARSFRPSLADDFFVTHIAQWERARLEAEALSPRLSNDLSVCPQRPFPIEQASDRDEKNSSMVRQSFHAHEGNGTSYPQHKDKLHDTSCTTVTGGVVDAGSKRPDQGTKRRRTQGNDENLQNLFPKEVLVEMCPLTHSFDCHDDMEKTLATHCNDDLEKTLATNSVDDLTTVSSPTMCSDSLFSLWYYLEHGYPLSPSRSCSLESSSG